MTTKRKRDGHLPPDYQWLCDEFNHGQKWQTGVATIPFSIKTNSLGFLIDKWELQIWPPIDGVHACDIRMHVPGHVPPSFQVDIAGVRTRDEVRQLVDSLCYIDGHRGVRGPLKSRV